MKVKFYIFVLVLGCVCNAALASASDCTHTTVTAVASTLDEAEDMIKLKAAELQASRYLITEATTKSKVHMTAIAEHCNK